MNDKLNKKMCANTERRSFLKKAGLLAGAFTVVPSSVLFAKKKVINNQGNVIKNGYVTPNDKINLACVGIGNRGGQIIRALVATGQVNVVALCDTDMGAKHTQGIMNMFPNAPRFQDFRKMFDKMGDKIDAVSVGTPDFSHFPISMLAMSLGIHVYVEKPLTRTFQEAELMMQAARKYKVVTQMGNQGHSDDNYFQFKAWVDAGVIKDVDKITCHMNSARRWHGWNTNMKSFPKGEKIPKTLDWDTWLGTAKHHDYHHDLINGQWRCWYDFGMGALGDWGAHIMDSFHQFLDLGLPYEIDPVMLEGHNKLFYPQASTLDFKFPERKEMPECVVTWYDGVNNKPELPKGYGGVSTDAAGIPTIAGKKASFKNLRPGKIIYSKDLTFKGGSHSSTLSIIPQEAAKDMEKNLPVYPEHTSNHFENFFLAIRGQEDARSNFDVAAPLSQVFCLGTIAQRLNTKLEFDRKTNQITNNKKANELLIGSAPRREWEEFYKL
jgi:hypothetical protein